MDSMKRRTFFRSLLGLMAIPFVGLKAKEPTGEVTLKWIREYPGGQEYGFHVLSRADVLERWPMSESDLHRQYRTGELGTLQTIIIDEETNVSRSI